MTSRKRSGSGSKRQFKEKVVQIYETIFKGEEINNPVNAQFWDEFFLLKPKVSILESEINKLTPEQLQVAKKNINELFTHSVLILEQENIIRATYGLLTLCAVLNGLYKKNLDTNEFLSSFDKFIPNIQKLLVFCQTVLEGDYPDNVKGLALKPLIILIIGLDNINQNALIEYIISSTLFDCLVELLSDVPTRQRHGYDVVLIITLLVNYRKYDATNPYIVKLSLLDHELTLNGYGQVIMASLTEFCNQYNVEHVENQNASWFSSLTNIVGNMFVSDEGGYRIQQIRYCSTVMLLFCNEDLNHLQKLQNIGMRTLLKANRLKQLS